MCTFRIDSAFIHRQVNMFSENFGNYLAKIEVIIIIISFSKSFRLPHYKDPQRAACSPCHIILIPSSKIINY